MVQATYMLDFGQAVEAYPDASFMSCKDIDTGKIQSPYIKDRQLTETELAIKLLFFFFALAGANHKRLCSLWKQKKQILCLKFIIPTGRVSIKIISIGGVSNSTEGNNLLGFSISVH